MPNLSKHPYSLAWSSSHTYQIAHDLETNIQAMCKHTTQDSNIRSEAHIWMSYNDIMLPPLCLLASKSLEQKHILCHRFIAHFHSLRARQDMYTLSITPDNITNAYTKPCS